MKKKSIYVIIAVVAVLSIILFVRVSKKKSQKVTEVNAESKKVSEKKSEKTNAPAILGKIPHFVIDQLDGFDEGEKLRHDGKIYQVANGHWKLVG